MKKILISFVILSMSFNLLADESLKNTAWKVTVKKNGEVSGLNYKGEKIIEKIGNFGVLGKKAVKTFSEVAELREKNKNTLVYEGISDDGNCPYVEFGEIVKLDKKFNFTLYTMWMPPSQWPADSSNGSVVFTKSIAQIKELKTSDDELLPPGTLTYELKLESGKKLIMKIIGSSSKRVSLKKQNGVYALDFSGVNNYVKDPTKENSRTRVYWIASTDSHYVKFIISAGK
jgi:hypothetical protein